MKYPIIMILCMSFFSVNAQSNVKLTGIVVSESSAGIDLASVALFSLPDSNYVKSEFTDNDGSFEIMDVEVGDYLLKVSFLGYKDYSKKIKITDALETYKVETILLVEDSEVLEEVVIKSRIPYIERKIDRTVVSPDALASNAGNNALEVLETAPGVSINNDGSIMMKGRAGVSVFINDKPSYLSGTELENYLRSLPASSIKNIEIMTNPPAKYEAEGNAGVININIKRGSLMGFNGNFSLAFRQGQKSNSNNSLNLNLNQKKFSIYTNLYAGFYNGFQDLNINRYYKDDNDIINTSFRQNSYNQNRGLYVNSKIGFDYYFSDLTSIGIAYKNAYQPGKRIVDNTSLVSDGSDKLIQRVVADNDDDKSFTNDLYSFYVSHKLDSIGSKLTLEADYVRYTSANDQVFQNFSYDPQDSLIFKNQLDGDIDSEILIYTAKTDFNTTFKNGTSLDAGLKTALSKTDNEVLYTTTINEQTTPNYDLSNRFLYDEWINAAYINHSRKIGKIDIQTGLRAETTNLTGEQRGNIEIPDTSFTRSYSSVFPTFYAATQIDTAGNHSISFSYGRRINRPYFQDLNPFISPLDRFTFYSGNADLVPTFSHNFSLTHSFKSLINLSLNYSKTKDGISETLEIRDGIYYSRPGNIANDEAFTISVDLSAPILEWYNLNAYVEIGHLKYKSQLYTEQLNSNGTYYYLSANNGFSLGKEWKLNLSGRYISDVVSAQLLIKSYGLINLGVQKQILKGKGTIKLSADDLVYTRRGSGVINNLKQTDADWNSKFDSRRIACSFSYRFGSAKFKKEKHQSVGSKDEQQRVRS